jgi:hypothetical protein
MNPPPLTNDLVVLQKQVRDLRVAVNLFWTLAILLLAVIVFSSFTFGVPKFEKIFDDMVPGGRTKLPVLTQMIFAWCRLWPLPQALMALISVVSLGLLWTLRSTGYACLIAMLACVFFIVQWFAFVLGCFLPLVTLTQTIGGA